MPGGLLDQLGFVVAVAFAIPVALLGLILLSGGDTILGVAMLVIAVGMVLVEELLLSPHEILVGMWRGDGKRIRDED